LFVELVIYKDCNLEIFPKIILYIQSKKKIRKPITDIYSKTCVPFRDKNIGGKSYIV